MADNRYECVGALCPYYKWEYINNIVCEGSKYLAIISVVAQSERDKVFYRRRFCETKYDECPIYKAIIEKYEEE